VLPQRKVHVEEEKVKVAVDGNVRSPYPLNLSFTNTDFTKPK
jgi:hypothetical protein